MSASIVRDTIAAELAKLTRVAPDPVAPFGHGSDIRCSSDVLEALDEVDGFTTLALAEALVRRLDCPRGALPDDAAYGIDLRSYCNRGVTAEDVRGLAGRIRMEIEKDDRVDSVAVRLTPSATGSELDVQIAVTPIDPNVGGFAMTLAVTSADLLLKEIR